MPAAWVTWGHVSSSGGDYRTLTMLTSTPTLQVKKKLEEVKAKKEASNPDDYLPDGIDR